MLNTACDDPEILNFFNNDRFVKKYTLTPDKDTGWDEP
jgi:hypothetical protein